jgi:hypothetical protein
VRSLAKTQAPLAIKTREESITSSEEFEEFGLAGMCDRPPAAAREEAVLLREFVHQSAMHYPMKGNDSVIPGVMEKMIENVLDESPLTADLHHFTNGARFQVVDVPAKDFLAVIAKNNLPEISVGLHPVHESQKPFQRMDVIFRPERIAVAEFGQAVKERFDVKFRGVRRGLGLDLTEWTERKSGGHAVHDATKGFRGKLQAGRKYGSC